MNDADDSNEHIGEWGEYFSDDNNDAVRNNEDPWNEEVVHRWPSQNLFAHLSPLADSPTFSVSDGQVFDSINNLCYYKCYSFKSYFNAAMNCL